MLQIIDTKMKAQTLSNQCWYNRSAKLYLTTLILRSVSVYCQSFIKITILHFLHNSAKYSKNASNQCLIKHFIAKASKKFKYWKAQKPASIPRKINALNGKNAYFNDNGFAVKSSEVRKIKIAPLKMIFHPNETCFITSFKHFVLHSLDHNLCSRVYESYTGLKTDKTYQMRSAPCKPDILKPTIL